jgi:hypothetical protein
MLTALLLHITLVFPTGHPFSPLTLRTAMLEASALWSPYGVAIDDGAACEWASGDTELVTVVIVEKRRSAGSSSPLGAITFGPDGTPAPFVTIFHSDLLRVIAGTRVLGAVEWQWPRTMREEIVGRVLGRVLAHEIGHYVLRSPNHRPGGLMQSVQFVDVLVSPERHAFVLSAKEAARLRSILTRETQR